MDQETVIRILEAANITPEQAKKILDYCNEPIEIEGEVFYRVWLPTKLERWLAKRARGEA